MELLIFLFKSGLSIDEEEKAAEGRAEQYRKVPGLIQKYNVSDKEAGQVGGVFVFDSKEHLLAFRDSEFLKSADEVFKFLEPPDIRVLEIVKVLRED